MKLYEVLDGHRKENDFPCIYRWVNNVNGKIYIGQTVHFYSRMAQYKNGRGTVHINNAFQKYGFDNFDIDVLVKCPKEELDEREQFWIDYYQSYDRDKGYNICPIASSTKGIKYSEEVCQKISQIVKERGPHLSGELNGMYGKTHTDEWKAEQSKRTKAMWEDPEYRKMQSERMKGEKNYFYGKRLCGELNPRYGKHCTEETKEKIRQALLGKPNTACAMPIKCVETGEEFASMTEAAKALHTYASAIKLAVDYPDRRTCRGFHFVKISE